MAEPDRRWVATWVPLWSAFVLLVALGLWCLFVAALFGGADPAEVLVFGVLAVACSLWSFPLSLRLRIADDGRVEVLRLLGMVRFSVKGLRAIERERFLSGPLIRRWLVRWEGGTIKVDAGPVGRRRFVEAVSAQNPTVAAGLDSRPGP